MMVFRPLARLASKSLAAWASVATLLILATVQPSATALEFPMTSHITLPDAANLTVAPITVEPTPPPVALFSEMQTAALVSSTELAMVAVQSRQIELARSTSGARIVARQLMKVDYNWGTPQYECLQKLWMHESHWNYRAHNYSSGAHGIAQALPADKMNIIGTDWRTNPVTQIRWGLHYIDLRYSSPCKALQNFNWRGYY